MVLHNQSLLCRI